MPSTVVFFSLTFSVVQLYIVACLLGTQPRDMEKPCQPLQPVEWGRLRGERFSHRAERTGRVSAQ